MGFEFDILGGSWQDLDNDSVARNSPVSGSFCIVIICRFRGDTIARQIVLFGSSLTRVSSNELFSHARRTSASSLSLPLSFFIFSCSSRACIYLFFMTRAIPSGRSRFDQLAVIFGLFFFFSSSETRTRERKGVWL